MKKSKMMRLSFHDIVKGFLISFLTVFLMGLYDIFNSGVIPMTWDEWRPLLATGLGSGLAYLIKNLLTNSEDKFLKKETT